MKNQYNICNVTTILSVIINIFYLFQKIEQLLFDFDVTSESNQIMSTNTINLPAFLEGAIKLESLYSIAKDPETMIPLSEGEYIHLGYEPLDESQAFAKVREKFQNPSPFGRINAWTIRTNAIRIPRTNVDGERLALLCHKFIYLNPGVDIIVPKRDYLNQPSKKSIFRCSVNYKTNGGKHANMQVEVSATIRTEIDAEEFLVSVTRTYGSNGVHSQFFNHLKLYLESNGNADPLMERSLLTTAVFSTVPPIPIEPGMGWNEIVEYLQSAKPSSEERRSLVEKVRGVKETECKRRLKRLKDIRRLRREEGCSDDNRVEYYRDESDSESSLDGHKGFVRNRKSPYVKYEHLVRGENADLEPAFPPEKYDLETAEGIMKYINHHCPYYDHMERVLAAPLYKVFSERNRLREKYEPQVSLQK